MPDSSLEPLRLPLSIRIAASPDGSHRAYWRDPPAADDPIRAHDLRELALALLDAASAIEDLDAPVPAEPDPRH